MNNDLRTWFWKSIYQHDFHNDSKNLKCKRKTNDDTLNDKHISNYCNLGFEFHSSMLMDKYLQKTYISVTKVMRSIELSYSLPYFCLL